LTSKKEEVLRQLRIVRKEKQMSYNQIMVALEELGCPLANSTVRRVFDERYRANDFKYETTLKPIVRVVLGLDEDFDDPETSALAAVVDYKDAKVEQLESELEKAQLALAKCQQELEEQKAIFKKMRKWLIGFAAAAGVLFIVLIISLMILEAYIVLDIDHLGWGLFFK
jgi:hypothetical protein